LILLLERYIFMAALPRRPDSWITLLNQIYLPDGIAFPLKLKIMDLVFKHATGAPCTVTTRFCVFVHPFAVNVYVYVTFIEEVVRLTRVSLILPCPLASVLMSPVTAARVQLNVVPVVALVGV